MLETDKYYHIYNRGNNHEIIFREEKNYDYFLKRYNFYLSDYLKTLAYCLMPNHFHFVIKIKKAQNEETFEVPGTSNVLYNNPRKLSDIEKAFKNFFISYSKSMNEAYNRTGSLFQAKYKKKEITSKEYLTQVFQYIHLNPVKSGLCKKCEEWKYSSYNVFIVNNPIEIEKNEVFELFDSRDNFIYCHNSKFTDKNIQDDFNF